MSVKLIFSFDSEDYETPAADDAEKWWAEAMARHGFTACLCIVGELARALRDRGRADVIAAMAQHEIAFHSDLHSAHPTWAEYLDTLGWEEGVQRALQEESRGLAAVEETFGQRPSAWCKPGSSWGPQIAQAMRLLGIPMFCDAPVEFAPGQPLWYTDNLCLKYHTAFDSYFSVPTSERLRRMQADFIELCARYDGGTLVMFTHPCRLVTAQFTDTFRHGANPPRSGWQPAPLRPESEIRDLQRDFDAFLAWVAQQSNVEPTTYRALTARYRTPKPLWLSAEAFSTLLMPDAPLDFRQAEGVWLSPAEQFGAVVHAVARLEAGRALSSPIPVRALLGPTSTPPAKISAGRCDWEAFLTAARQADTECSQTGAVPACIALGERHVGPHTFLQSALHVLATWKTTQQPLGRIEIRPAPDYPAISEREDFRRLHFKDSWSIFLPEFAGENVLETIRLQAWTAKPAVPLH